MEYYLQTGLPLPVNFPVGYTRLSYVEQDDEIVVVTVVEDVVGWEFSVDRRGESIGATLYTTGGERRLAWDEHTFNEAASAVADLI